MKMYKQPETTCLQVQNLAALCGVSSGNNPGANQAGVQSVTMRSSAQWEQ